MADSTRQQLIIPPSAQRELEQRRLATLAAQSLSSGTGSRLPFGPAEMEALGLYEMQGRFVAGNQAAFGTMFPDLYKALSIGRPQPRKLLVAGVYNNSYQGIQDPVQATGASFNILRAFASDSVMRAIIEALVRLCAAFFTPPAYSGGPGCGIVMRNGDTSPDGVDERWLKYVEQLLFAGGIVTTRAVDGARGVFSADGVDEALPFFAAMCCLVRDLVVLDHAGVWFNRTADEQVPWSFYKPLDGALLRRVLVQLPPTVEVATGSGAYHPYQRQIRTDLKRVEFVLMTPDGQVASEYGRGELAHLMRNPRTDWWTQGYGYSELESLIEIIVGLKCALQYNVGQFTEGHVPQAFLHGKGAFSPEWTEEFKHTIRTGVGGPGKWQTLPVIFGEADSDLKLIPLRPGDRDDVKWRDLITLFINIACGCLGVSAEEIGFQSFLTKGGLQTGTGGAERVAASHEIGLRSLLTYIEWAVDTFWIAPIAADEGTGVGPFKFKIFGLHEQDEGEALRMAEQRINAGLSSINEERAQMDLPPVRDPVDAQMWEDVTQELIQRQPSLKRNPKRLQELAEQVYVGRGGRLRQWANIPVNSLGLQMRMQEMQSEQPAQPEQPEPGMPMPPGMGGMEQQPGMEQPQGMPEQEQTCGPGAEPMGPAPEQQVAKSVASVASDDGLLAEAAAKLSKAASLVSGWLRPRRALWGEPLTRPLYREGMTKLDIDDAIEYLDGSIEYPEDDDA